MSVKGLKGAEGRGAADGVSDEGSKIPTLERVAEVIKFANAMILDNRFQECSCSDFAKHIEDHGTPAEHLAALMLIAPTVMEIEERRERESK